MRKLLILSGLVFTLSTSVFGQNTKFPDYHSPLGIPAVLSSNFGELRPNHFHMGIDYKTNGKIGYNLYSIADGFVSRIKVSPYGYGKVIYIDHPDGNTSVYAHCSEFKGAIDSIVRAVQHQEQNFAVEIFPKKNEISVKRGQVIAISGNTGSSTAPHLHFEIRDTKTEHALNPLVYGFDIADNKAPVIRGVKVYSLTKDGYRYPTMNARRTAKKGSTTYYISENKITIPATYLTKSGGVGFAFDVIDRLDAAPNKCGLYGSILLVNGDTLFSQQTDRVPFESTKYVNCHKDYEEYSVHKRKFHKCYRTRENDLPIYSNDEDLGIFSAEPGSTHDVRYIAYDPQGNKSELKFKLVISNGTLGEDERLAPDLSYLLPSQSMRVENKGTTVDFGVGTVYEPIQMKQTTIDKTVGKANTPVHNSYRIMVDHKGEQDGKDYIEITTAKGKRRTLDIEYEDDKIVCESKYFGNYRLRRDTIKPSITPINFSKKSTIYTRNIIQWQISDIGTGIADYDLFIDGDWKLLEYEYKSRTVTYTREKGLSGKKEVLIRVVDDCGNTKEWKTNLTFN